ncbi:outer-membrane lipoprotein carrier protein LolA [Bosea sp. 117]|uniref:outer-membrane lipoprotein carrier protein LolA n=1 Tax=Bosea sp. 117 TaxID=1125973 RepID=UPI000AC4DF6B|nr:outer-membrane lipoprotein carrier protein LolA [Bosea sp. 117]
MRLTMRPLAACAALLLSASAAFAQQGILLPPGMVPGGSQGAPAQAVPAPATSTPVTSAPAPGPVMAAPAPAARAPAPAPAAPTAYAQPPLPASGPRPIPAPLPKESAAQIAAQGAVGGQQAAAEPAVTGTAHAAPAAPAPVAPDTMPVQVAAAGTGAGKPRANAATIERINNYFNSFKTMTGTFVQVDPDGTRKQGEFSIFKPGRVLFEYDPPSQIVLVADGRSVSVRDKRLKTQDISPLSQTPLRFLLSENLDLARNGNVTGVYQDDVFATVVLEENQPMVGTYRLMIMFDAKTMQLKQWTVTDPQGYDTTVAVYNLNTSVRPDPMLFVINRN